jgi:hypothetical protein
MLVCLLAPLAALSAIFLFNVPAGSVLTLGLLLLCPAMHLLMMRNMGHGSHEHGAGRQGEPAIEAHHRSHHQENPQYDFPPAEKADRDKALVG